jgi:hypothetical protein
MHHPKIRIAVTATYFMMKTGCFQTATHPVLKMKLLIPPALTRQTSVLFRIALTHWLKTVEIVVLEDIAYIPGLLLLTPSILN